MPIRLKANQEAENSIDEGSPDKLRENESFDDSLLSPSREG